MEQRLGTTQVYFGSGTSRLRPKVAFGRFGTKGEDVCMEGKGNPSLIRVFGKFFFVFYFGIYRGDSGLVELQELVVGFSAFKRASKTIPWENVG
jgi:hypothetical protein